MSYAIYRFYYDPNHPDHMKKIAGGLTLEEAQEHCQREDTHEHDAEGNVVWFDGYGEEPEQEPEHEVHFGTLHEDGTVTDERTISSADIRACPHYIMVPEHYRADGSCRCDDPDATVMAEWGYRWDNLRELWV